MIEIFLMHNDRLSGGDQLVVEAHDPGLALAPVSGSGSAAEWKAKPAFYLVERLLNRISDADPVWRPTFKTHIGGERVEPSFNCVAVHGGQNGIYTIEIKLPRTSENDRAIHSLGASWTYQHQGSARREHYRIQIDAEWDENRLELLGDLLLQANARWLSEGIAR